MTTISFTDGDRVVMRDNGMIGTEQGCCCCCLTLIPRGVFLGLDPELWDTCIKGIWETIKGRLEAAGWTVSINVDYYNDANDTFFAWPVMTVTCGDCFDCAAWVDKAATWTMTGPNFDDDADLWVDVQGQGLIYCGGPFQFGYFNLGGCCKEFGQFQGTVPFEIYTPATINGVGDGGSTWVPVCNPLP